MEKTFSPPKVTIDLSEYESLKKEIVDLKSTNEISPEELSSAINCLIIAVVNKVNTERELNEHFKETGIRVLIKHDVHGEEPFITITKPKK